MSGETGEAVTGTDVDLVIHICDSCLTPSVSRQPTTVTPATVTAFQTTWDIERYLLLHARSVHDVEATAGGR